jgi:plastocyanin
MIPRRWLAVGAAAAMLLGAACADEEGAEPAAGSGPGETAATGPTAPEPGAMGGDIGGADAGGGRYDYGSDGTGDAADGGEAGVQADVTAENYAFSPAEIETAAGSDLSVGNANAETPHTFTVDGSDIDVELDPKAVEVIAVDLAPGTYTFRCRFHGSMIGTLTVA